MVFMVTRLGIVFNVIERRGGTSWRCCAWRSSWRCSTQRADRGAAADRARARLAGGSLQWVVTGYVVVYAGFLLAAGRIADALGRKRVFLAGLALFTAASLACAAAPTSAALIAARAFQGLGAALLAPAALALLPKDGVSVWTATAAVGGASGLMVGGLLAGRSAGAGSS